jgi:hypothetical protein
MTIRRLLSAAVLLACAALSISCGHTTAVVCPETETRRWEVAPEWLQQRVTAAGIEAVWLKEIDFKTIPEADKPLLLALFHRNLASFSAKVTSGDQLWFFSTPPRDWNAHGGRSGFVAIRDCRVVAVLVAKES